MLNGSTVTNFAGSTARTVQVDAADATHFSTLDLENATISGGFVNVYGLLNSTGSSFITDATITNTGTIEAASGTLIVDSPITGTGSAMIGANAILEFQSSVPATQTIAYSGSPGTLALSDPTGFHASITGLVYFDIIDLTDIAPSDIASATIEGPTLVVQETTAPVAR